MLFGANILKSNPCSGQNSDFNIIEHYGPIFGPQMYPQVQQMHPDNKSNQKVQGSKARLTKADRKKKNIDAQMGAQAKISARKSVANLQEGALHFAQ